MIGNMIKARRSELGFTQAQLSEMTGIKSTTISNYENNISSPSDDNIYKLMEALKCDANYLFEWEEMKDIQLSAKEKMVIKNYRKLDTYGKRMVDSALEIEYERCTNEENTIKVYRAARSADNHKDDIVEMSAEQVKRIENAEESDDEI